MRKCRLPNLDVHPCPSKEWDAVRPQAYDLARSSNSNRLSSIAPSHKLEVIHSTGVIPTWRSIWCVVAFFDKNWSSDIVSHFRPIVTFDGTTLIIRSATDDGAYGKLEPTQQLLPVEGVSVFLFVFVKAASTGRTILVQDRHLFTFSRYWPVSFLTNRLFAPNCYLECSYL